MRQALRDLVDKTIVFKYNLPNTTLGLSKSTFSTVEDQCFENTDPDELASVIYNSLIEYAFNEFDLAKHDYDDMMPRVLNYRLNYKPSHSASKKISYGFHGEALLYSILYAKMGANPLIARGYFYDPLSNSETFGYDSYHLIQNGGQTELWFGEVKFRKTYKSCIDSALGNIEKAISDKYLESNLVAMSRFNDKLNLTGTPVNTILNAWDQDALVVLGDEIKKYDLKLVYPIFLLYDLDESGYNKSIELALLHIASHMCKTYSISIPYTIYFIFLPVSTAKQIKSKVIEWIELKKPLI